MSEIRATTISNMAGTGPIALTGQLGVKAFSKTDGSSVIESSFNVSSAIDQGTIGRTDINITTALASGYVVNSTAGTSNDGIVAALIDSSIRWRTYSWDGATRTDYRTFSVATGDIV